MVTEVETGKSPGLAFRKKTNFSRPPVATKQALSYLYGIFHFMGLLKTSKYQYVYTLYAIFIHGCLTIFLPVSFIASYFLKANKSLDYDRLLFSIQVAIDVFGCVLKITILLISMPKLLTTEEVMAKLDKRCQSEDEIKLLYGIRKKGRKLVVIYSIIFWSYAISTFIGSILAGHPPYSLYLPYINWRNSKWEFLVASFIEFLLMSGACYQQVANDSYPTVYVCILRGHVNILRLRIRKLGTDKHKPLKRNEQELKMCIKDHQHIIQLYNIISPIVSGTVFLQFLNSAAIFGITLINILIFAKDYSFAIASSFYLFAVIVEIFPLCYSANGLFCDCEILSVEIFHSQWIEQNKRYRKMIIFFLQRSQQTMQLMAAKFVPINLNSFINIAKFSFSLYTLIKKMNIKEKLAHQ